MVSVCAVYDIQEHGTNTLGAQAPVAKVRDVQSFLYVRTLPEGISTIAQAHGHLIAHREVRFNGIVRRRALVRDLVCGNTG